MSLQQEFVKLQGAGRKQLRRHCWRVTIMSNKLVLGDKINNQDAGLFNYPVVIGGTCALANDLDLDLTFDLTNGTVLVVLVETFAP